MPISPDQFTARLVALCLRSRIVGLPRKEADRHILFKSILLTLDVTRDHTQAELTEALSVWLSEIGRGVETDHAALRRHLVDEGYLQRTADGRSYRASPSDGLRCRFATEIDAIDVRAVIQAGLARIAEKRRKHFQGG